VAQSLSERHRIEALLLASRLPRVPPSVPNALVLPRDDGGRSEKLAKRHMWERPYRDPNVKEAERQLMAALGTKVTIADKGGRGKVVIEYKTLEDFDRIIEALGK